MEMNGKMEGNERKMEGNERKMNGNERKMKGNERNMEGNERKMNGNERNERKMNGNERKMEGNERKMNGNERKMEGNERKVNVFLRVFARHDLKIDVSREASVIFITCQKMPRLRRNLHLGTTLRSADIAIRKKTRNMKLRDDAKLLRLPHKIDVDALKRTRVGATSRSRDKAISVLGRKSRKTQKTPLRAFPLGRELTTTRRRHDDDTTTSPRRHDDDTTTTQRRAHDDTTNTTRTQVQPPDPQL